MIKSELAAELNIHPSQLSRRLHDLIAVRIEYGVATDGSSQAAGLAQYNLDGQTVAHLRAMHDLLRSRRVRTARQAAISVLGVNNEGVEPAIATRILEQFTSIDNRLRLIEPLLNDMHNYLMDAKAERASRHFQQQRLITPDVEASNQGGAVEIESITADAREILADLHLNPEVRKQ